MRILLVLAIWIILVGGLFLYMKAKGTPESAHVFEMEKAKETYSLHIISTSSAIPDPFALRTDDSVEPASIIVKINGVEAVRIVEPVNASKEIIVHDIPGLILGLNEFYVEVNPPTEMSNEIHAVKISIFLGGREIVSESIWSEEGVKIAGTFTLRIEDGVTNKIKNESDTN